MKESVLKNESKYDIARIIFLIGLFFLSFIFLNVSLSCILFFFKISINKIVPMVSFLISCIINLLILRKYGYLSIKKWYYCLIAIVLPIFLILISFLLNGKVYDYTYDGNAYHKVAIGMLADGWNPVYEDMEQFDLNRENPLYSSSGLWVNHYAKGSHIFAANIYKLTGNIECGKCINTLSILLLFCFIFSFLLSKKKSVIFSLFFAICVITYPVVSAQYLTNYVDLLLYIYLLLTLFMFFSFENSEKFLHKNILLFMYFMILSIIINVKFTGFAYAGIFCLGYFIWFIIRFKKKELDKIFFIKFIIVSFVSVLFSVIVIGFSPYVKNFFEHGNPFYPLMGEGKIDIMTANEPEYFVNKTAIEKFIIATFSEADNIMQFSGEKATFKIPFTYNKYELDVIGGCDLRISGNGILFSGIFLISLLIVILLSFFVYRKDKKLFYLTIIPVTITIVMIFILGESWWARYFPQIYFIVLTALIFCNTLNKKYLNIILYILIALILINNYCTFSSATELSYDYTVETNRQFDIYNETNNEQCNLQIYTSNFQGAIYNVYDKIKIKDIEVLNPNEYSFDDQFIPLVGTYLGWRCEINEVS